MASLTLDWYQLASAVGAVQGVLLAGVLFVQRGNRTANRLLAVLMAAFSIFLASTVYHSTDAFFRFPHLFGSGYPMPWIYGPLVYLYAVAASDQSWRPSKRELFHFLPVAGVLVLIAPIYAMTGAEKVAMYHRFAAGDVPAAIAAVDPLKYVSGIGYSIATIVHLRRHRRRVLESYSNLANVNLAWLRRLAVAAGTIWLLAAALRISDVGGRVRDAHISLAIALLVYSIGYMGLRQPEVFRFEAAGAPPDTEGDAPAAERAPDPGLRVGRYERPAIAELEAEKLERSLVALMEAERPWRDSDLTLADLSAMLETTPHKLSALLNTRIGATFYDFINRYRVREVQRRIEAGDARRLKMLALALDAGFASKSTFNEAFKKHTSQTPSGFRQAVGA